MTESKKHDQEKLAGLRHVPRAAMLRAIAGTAHNLNPHPEHFSVGVAHLAFCWDGVLSPSYAPQLVRIAGPALEMGANKYGAYNFAITGFKVSRLLDACARHLLCLGGTSEAPIISPNDPESGLPHTCHAAAMLLFAFECSLHADLADHSAPKERKLCR